MNGNEFLRDWMSQHGNKKNADIKRLIMIIESILKNETIKNSLYLGIAFGGGILTLKTILDFINEHYAIKYEAELEKIKIEHKNKEEV